MIKHKRVFATLAAVLAFTLAAVGAAQPAQASSINGCDNGGTGGVICLYNWIDFNKGGGFWRRTFPQMGDYSRNCASLNTHYWDIGGIIYDNPPSSHVAHQTGGTNKVVRFYDWINCNGAGAYVDMYVPINGLSQDNNLSTTDPAHNGGGFDTDWFKRVSSVQLCSFTTATGPVCE